MYLKSHLTSNVYIIRSCHGTDPAGVEVELEVFTLFLGSSAISVWSFCLIDIMHIASMIQGQHRGCHPRDLKLLYAG